MATQREILLKEMERRPEDPWPRGEGHLVLAEPGSPREQKAYHEPGGLFSPSPGSFGVSFWSLDSQGRRLATSEGLAPSEIRQFFRWRDEAAPPAIQTETPFFSCEWSAAGLGRWCCKLSAKSDAKLAVVFRSVGPAGAPLARVAWNGAELALANRWIVSFESACAVFATLGDEARDGFDSRRALSSISSDAGWAFALVEMRGDAMEIRIRDTAPAFASPLPFRGTRTNVEMALPSDEFMASLDAQAAHLLMGCVGAQTSPGEPLNYPLTWERDGAYAVLALARAGQIETAKALCVHFAENDFFGGFGVEADAPGSSLNAIVETAFISGDRAFMEFLWPHVERKFRIIEEMLSASGPLEKERVGPIVPACRGDKRMTLACEAAKDGLITGYMDHHQPLIYVNAVSFRGCAQAAKLARALGRNDAACQMDSLAAGVRRACLARFFSKEFYNERNFIIAVWPTWLAQASDPAFVAALQARRDEVFKDGSFLKRPLWTYFNLAEAHQWLLAGRPEAARAALEYFWRNQCSPGLYTFWEGEGEENSFGLWREIRGWAKPKHVTPHYWAASEMLLLQLDMLAYVDESSTEPALVVGAGVPHEWLKRPMEISGVRSVLGEISWSYAPKRSLLRVYVKGGAERPVRAAGAFANGVKMEVSFLDAGNRRRHKMK